MKQLKKDEFYCTVQLFLGAVFPSCSILNRTKLVPSDAPCCHPVPSPTASCAYAPPQEDSL